MYTKCILLIYFQGFKVYKICVFVDYVSEYVPTFLCCYWEGGWGCTGLWDT